MNFSTYFARRITFKGTQTVSKLVVILALISIALGVAVMEISVSIVKGFENEIEDKIIGFTSHLQISTYLPEANEEFKTLPKNSDFLKELVKNKEIVKIAPYLTKPALIRSKQNMEGIVLKGVDTSWNKSFFANALKEGKLPVFGSSTNKILISKKISNMLNLKSGSKAKLFFMGDKIRARVVFVEGIYETGLTEFDQVMIFCDLNLVQEIMNLKPNDIEGFDIFLENKHNLIEKAEKYDKILPPEYRLRPVQDLYREIFDWLSLQHQNVYFILILMTLISIINMASAIIILMIERTPTIGVLKALGASNFMIQRIFLNNAFYLILIGVLVGNFLGLGLLALQENTGLIQLDPESYFVKTAPVAWTWLKFLEINFFTILICSISMIIPTFFINNIKITRAIKM